MNQYQEIALGVRLHALESCGVAIHEVAYRPGAHFEPHSHAHANISLVLSGDFAELVEGRQHQIAAGSVVFKPAGTVHSNRYGRAGARTMIVEFDPADGSWIWWEEEGLQECQWHLSGPCIAAALRLYRDAFQQPTAPDRETTIANDVIELVAFARLSDDRFAANVRPVVRRARDAVLDGFREGIGVQAIAEDIGVHPVYLARAFRAEYRCSLTDFRRHLQISEAAVRLAITDAPIAEIALASGFADQSHLSRQFRTHLGATPGSYRRQTRQTS